MIKARRSLVYKGHSKHSRHFVLSLLVVISYIQPGLFLHTAGRYNVIAIVLYPLRTETGRMAAVS